MTREQLQERVNELTRHAIADIEKHWRMTPGSPDAAREPQKYDWRHSIRYAMAQAIVQTYVVERDEQRG